MTGETWEPAAPREAWLLLARIQDVIQHQPAVANAVRCLSLHEQLDLTLELLRHDDSAVDERSESLPANVIPFRPRRLR